MRDIPSKHNCRKASFICDISEEVNNNIPLVLMDKKFPFEVSSKLTFRGFNIYLDMKIISRLNFILFHVQTVPSTLFIITVPYPRPLNRPPRFVIEISVPFPSNTNPSGTKWNMTFSRRIINRTKAFNVVRAEMKGKRQRTGNRLDGSKRIRDEQWKKRISIVMRLTEKETGQLDCQDGRVGKLFAR